MVLTHSKEFIAKWKEALVELYSYEEYMDFIVVPSLFGKKSLVYLPLLNYSDRLSDNIEDLRQLAQDNKYQIRALNSKYTDFKDGDTVTMRLDLKNRSSDELFNEFRSDTKKNIRRSINRNDFTFKIENSKSSIDDFYNLFSQTMKRHGTPTIDKKFFYILKDKLGDDIKFLNIYDDLKCISSQCILFDKNLAILPWIGTDDTYFKTFVGYFSYWHTIDFINQKEIDILDFGRSGYNTTTHKFKSQWGAKPIKIDILKSKNEDIYSKYSLASKIWQKLPSRVVDFLGPKLCKYLEDL